MLWIVLLFMFFMLIHNFFQFFSKMPEKNIQRSSKTGSDSSEKYHSKISRSCKYDSQIMNLLREKFITFVIYLLDGKYLIFFIICFCFVFHSFLIFSFF